MYSGKQIKGLPVYWQNQILGRVKDFVLDQKTGKAKGIIVENSSLWKKNRFIPWEKIAALTENGLAIKYKKDLTSIKQNAGLGFTTYKWYGARLISTAGEDRGTVADVFLEFPSGKLSGLEISQGLVSDMQQGRYFLPWQRIQTGEGFDGVVALKEQNWQ